MVLSWPVRVVAAWVRLREVKRGRRKVEVQPAPRMRMSMGGVVEVEVGEGGWLCCVIVMNEALVAEEGKDCLGISPLFGGSSVEGIDSNLESGRVHGGSVKPTDGC